MSLWTNQVELRALVEKNDEVYDDVFQKDYQIAVQPNITEKVMNYFMKKQDGYFMLLNSSN